MIKFKIAAIAAGMIFAGTAASANCWISGCYSGNTYVSGPYVGTTTYVRHGYVGRAYNAPTVVAPTYAAQPVYVAPSGVSAAYAPSGQARASYLGYNPYSTNYGSNNFGRPSVTDYYAERSSNFAAGVGGLYTPGVAGYGRAPSDAEIMGGDTTFPRRTWDAYTASVPTRTWVPAAGVVVSNRGATWGSYGRAPSEPRYLDGQVSGGAVAVVPSLSVHNPRAQQVFHEQALADDTN